MSVLNHHHQYIFFHEPHTGGRSMEQVLMTHGGSQNFNGDHHITACKMISGGWVTSKQFDAYYKFRVIRNPYDWLVTCWIRNNRCNDPFNKWVFKAGLGFMTYGTLFWRHFNQTDIDFRFESMLEDYNSAFSGVKGLFVKEFPHIGCAQNKPNWRDLLTVRQAKRLEEVYPDIKVYGYSIFSE